MPFPTGIVDALDPARLRLLVEVDRRGSISAAAEACRMSQPSATKHLKTLEALRGAEIGTLALAASTTPGTYVLPSILQCFSERHPGVDVDIATGPSTWVAERVAKREYALGIAGEVDLPDGVRAEPFLDDEIVGIAKPGRLRLRRGKASVAELSRSTLLVREAGSSTRTVADRYLARAGYRPANRWELDSNEAIKRSVQAGLGVGFVSKLVVEDEVGRGELVSFRIEGTEPMRRSIYLLLPDDRESTPSERAFIATLSDCCSVSVAGCSA